MAYFIFHAQPISCIGKKFFELLVIFWHLKLADFFLSGFYTNRKSICTVFKLVCQPGVILLLSTIPAIQMGLFVHTAREGKLNRIVKRYLKSPSPMRFLESFGQSAENARVRFIRMYFAQVGIVPYFTGERKHRNTWLKLIGNYLGGTFKISTGFVVFLLSLLHGCKYIGFFIFIF